MELVEASVLQADQPDHPRHTLKSTTLGWGHYALYSNTSRPRAFAMGAAITSATKRASKNKEGQKHSIAAMDLTCQIRGMLPGWLRAEVEEVKGKEGKLIDTDSKRPIAYVSRTKLIKQNGFGKVDSQYVLATWRGSSRQPDYYSWRMEPWTP